MKSRQKSAENQAAVKTQLLVILNKKNSIALGYFTLASSVKLDKFVSALRKWQFLTLSQL